MKELSKDEIKNLQKYDEVVYVKKNGDVKSGIFLAYYENSNKVFLKSGFGEFTWYINLDYNKILGRGD